MRTLPEMIGVIYDSILAPNSWQDVLGRLCDALDAKAASINVVNPIAGKASLFVEHGTEPAWTELLLRRYAAMSPIGAAVLMAELDQPVGAFDFIDEDEFVESRFYQEWCRPQGYHDMLGALIAKRPHEVGALSTTRTRDKGRFTGEHREIIGTVAPHVRRAVTISGLLERRTIEKNAFVGIVDQLAVAIVLVDRQGRVQRMNAAGDAMAAAGQIFGAPDGALTLATKEATLALHQALAGDLDQPTLIPVATGSGHRFMAAVMQAEPRSGLYAVLINEPEMEIPPIGKHLAQLFSLTPREVAVLMPLVEGKTIEETAETLGISQATARTHLSRIMAKTRTTRQAELLQTVMRAIPPLRMGS